MKKLIALIVILFLLVLSVACEKDKKKITIITTTEIGETDEILSTSTTYQIDNSKVDETKNDNGGGYIESRKYRQCYYDVPYDFIVLVGEDEFDRWYEDIYKFNPDKSQFVEFIQYFTISKEVFEKTNLQMAKSFAEFNPTMRPLDYENQQTYEIYNTDIIYTFDDEIINEYYLTPDYPYCADFEYESAVRRGEYTPQTEEWVDVEAMEAEIIAKYGEAEIVTTETAEENIAETTKAEIQTEASTDIPTVSAVTEA